MSTRHFEYHPDFNNQPPEPPSGKRFSVPLLRELVGGQWRDATELVEGLRYFRDERELRAYLESKVGAVELERGGHIQRDETP